jgi:hypothetical protein
VVLQLSCSLLLPVTAVEQKARSMGSSSEGNVPGKNWKVEALGVNIHERNVGPGI